MHFYSPTYLYLLAVIPVMVLMMAWAEWRRRKNIKRLGDKQLINALMPDASAKRRWIKFLLIQIIIALVVIMVARPQMGIKVSHEKRNGIEALICLDISNSMLATDVAPSRLQKSKMLIENMVDHFTKDKIGLIVFAGDAYVQLPITSDYVSAKMFLQNIEPSLIQTQGTNIGEAINLAANSFTQQENIGKAIIVITDGEDHEGGAMEAAKEASEKGYKVFILGIGNTTGAPIPVAGGGFLTDNTGNTVMTSLNEQMCKDIAAAGKGTYIHVDNTSAAQESLNNELSKMQKGDMESVVYSEFEEVYQWFGILAIILLILEVVISETANPFFKKFSLYKKRNVTVVVMLLLCCLSANAQNADRHFIRQGNRTFHQNVQESPAKAEVQYRKALTANPNNSQAMYNLGCALLAQNKDSLAMEMFQASAKAETSKQRKAMSYHNMGVIMQKQQQYGPAIEMYKEALRLTPHDNETRYNLVLCQRQQKQNQNQNQNNQNQQNKNDKNKDKNKDNKDKNNKDKNQDKNKDDNKQNNDQKQPQQMSRENAEQLLQAAVQEEKATQQRLNKAMSQPRRRNIQKNW